MLPTVFHLLYGIQRVFVLTARKSHLAYSIMQLDSTILFVYCSDFRFVWGRKWLIIEPKSPQSFKTIYQVLKFAWKHKSPLNRSALTYWEEKVPSRMDLGKSRYGGPFTTEQVEDVKTIFRLIPLWFNIGAYLEQH